MATRISEPSPDDIRWMDRAIELAAQCVTEPGRTEASPKVGAVAVSPDGELVAEAYRGEDPNHAGDHAEFALIQKANEARGGQLQGATVFTTLEPCTSRSVGKTPCANRLIDEGVATVYIGMFDPDPRVRELGWKRLHESGVAVFDFPQESRARLLGINNEFIDRYRRGSGMSGSATFDYELNDGNYEIAVEGAKFHTKWSKSGIGSVIAYGHNCPVALARYATIDALDDPDAYEFSSSHQRPKVGQVIVYRSNTAYCLIRIDGVMSGEDYGEDRTEVSITWEIRLP